MSNLNTIKNWSREDMARTLMSIYFAVAANGSQRTEDNDHYRVGFAAALSSVALAVGVNPESFIAPEDIQRLKSSAR